ncbi:MAG TPA: hypothetical protein VIC82_05985, partial [Candidatus Nanopelagicales bacterium]
ITDGHANGSMTWHTAWGQQVTTEPRPYLDTPNPPGPAAVDHDDTGPRANQTSPTRPTTIAKARFPSDLRRGSGKVVRAMRPEPAMRLGPAVAAAVRRG